MPLMTVTSRKFMVKSSNGIPKKRSAAGCSENDCLMILITLMNSAGGKASDLFGELTGIAVLLTMLPPLLLLR